MSHLLLSKKIGIGILVVACMFLGMAYAWIYYTDQWIAQSELPVQEPAAEQSGEQAPLAEEAAYSTEKPLKENSFEKSEAKYPYIVRMEQRKIGLYTLDGNCVRDLIQVGEGLSETDQKLLQQGIWVENEKDLVEVLESYHLQ